MGGESMSAIESNPIAESPQLQSVTDNSSMNNVSVLSNSTLQHENVSYGNSNFSICQSDPAFWKDLKEAQCYWISIKEIPDQNVGDQNFKKSQKVTDTKIRCCSLNFFFLS
nr:uncharacterized protein LOC124812302 [Hydra vulgaris]